MTITIFIIRDSRNVVFYFLRCRFDSSSGRRRFFPNCPQVRPQRGSAESLLPDPALLSVLLHSLRYSKPTGVEHLSSMLFINNQYGLQICPIDPLIQISNLLSPALPVWHLSLNRMQIRTLHDPSRFCCSCSFSVHPLLVSSALPLRHSAIKYVLPVPAGNGQDDHCQILEYISTTSNLMIFHGIV